MIKIDFNKNLDYEVYKDFYDFKTAGVDFGARITKDHPDITIENYIKYIDKFIKTATEKLNKNSGKLWELSEIFNVIILNQKEFYDILKREEKLFYPSLGDKLVVVKKLWDENHGDINDFITKSLSVL